MVCGFSFALTFRIQRVTSQAAPSRRARPRTPLAAKPTMWLVGWLCCCDGVAVAVAVGAEAEDTAAAKDMAGDCCVVVGVEPVIVDRCTDIIVDLSTDIVALLLLEVVFFIASLIARRGPFSNSSFCSRAQSQKTMQTGPSPTCTGRSVGKACREWVPSMGTTLGTDADRLLRMGEGALAVNVGPKIVVVDVDVVGERDGEEIDGSQDGMKQ